MRREDLRQFEEPYAESRIEIDRRFHASIGADVPSANALVREILNDLDDTTLGIRWWNLPNEERILISDYLYQCGFAIETNLVEAKLHILEWLDTREQENWRLADVVSIDGLGNVSAEIPSSTAPIHDLPARLEDMHICGFFQAIGSSLDCLAAVIVGVLGLDTPFRRSGTIQTEQALQGIASNGNRIQLDFRDFYETTKTACGPDDWLSWAQQYRHMLIHRGRRLIRHTLAARENPLFDSRERLIPRTNVTTHLSKDPDRSDVEAWIKSRYITLQEDAEITLNGVFNSSRVFEETICGRLVSIWQERRQNPILIQQPASQWNSNIRACNFDGYSDEGEDESAGRSGMANRVVLHRMLAAAVDDQHRGFWASSPYL